MDCTPCTRDYTAYIDYVSTSPQNPNPVLGNHEVSPSMNQNDRSRLRHHTFHPKRPHTKSRRGCFNCKTRKVKCQETKPACENCLSRNTECVYPSRESRRSANSPGVRKSASLISTKQISPGPHTGDDLRFFHHFLRVARPHLPFGSEESWKAQVPAYAHDCPYLMHAILSLGATNCTIALPNGAQYTPMVIAHRGKALKLLSTTIAKGDQCTDLELDCILATCYILAFQSYCMTDGLVDFAVMVRGCGTVTRQIQQRFKNSKIFSIQSHSEVKATVAPRLPQQPYSDTAFLNRCIEDLDRIEPLVEGSTHGAFLVAIRKAYQGLQQSIGGGFAGMTEIYSVWYSMDNMMFMKLIASANHVSRALFVHYLMIDTLMRPYILKIVNLPDDYAHLNLSFNAKMIDQWTTAIYETLPVTIQEMVQFEVYAIAQEKERCASMLMTAVVAP